MLDFYFVISFTTDRYEEYIHIVAPTAMCAWDNLDALLKALEWDNINYGETRMIPVRTFQNSHGEFFGKFGKYLDK